MAKVVKGVRVQRCRTYAHRWGPGRVHLETYRVAEDGVLTVAGRKMWIPACSAQPFHAELIIDDSAPAAVTCRKCLATGLVPKAWLPQENAAQ